MVTFLTKSEALAKIGGKFIPYVLIQTVQKLSPPYTCYEEYGFRLLRDKGETEREEGICLGWTLNEVELMRLGMAECSACNIWHTDGCSTLYFARMASQQHSIANDKQARSSGMCGNCGATGEVGAVHFCGPLPPSLDSLITQELYSYPTVATECTRSTCPDILHGHQSGCPYYKDGN